jgi:hypothetical protein
MNIGENLKRKQRDQRNAKQKRDLLLQAQGFIERYELPAEPKQMDAEGFYSYFLRLFSETYTNYPSFMSAEEKVKAANIDILPLRTLEASYKSITTPFDPLTMDIPTTEDYSIVLEGIEEELYLVRAETIQQLEKLQATAAKKINTIYGIATVYPKLEPLLKDLKDRNTIEAFSTL